MRALVGSIAIAVALLAAPADVAADECGDCKSDCRRGEDDCKKAARNPLCKVPGVGGVCTIFKNGQCRAAGSICRQTRCGTIPGCNGGPSAGGGQISGDPHFYSLDRMRFDFQGAGEFLAARSERADIEIHARFTPLGTRASVVSMLAIKTGGHVIVFERDKGVIIDNQSIALNEDDVYIQDSVALSRTVRGKYLITTGGSALWVRVGTSSLDLFMEPDAGSRGTWEGLMGNFDGKPENDFRTRDGTVLDSGDMSREVLYDTFGNSWRLTQAESLLRYADGETTKTHTDLLFPREDHSIATQDPKAFEAAHATCIAKGVRGGEALRNCIYDLSATGSDEFAESYADAHAVAAAAAVAFSSTFSMRAQRTGYQGEEVPVFWSGSSELGDISVVDSEGKVLAQTWTRKGSPAALRLPAEPGEYTLRFKQGDKEASQPLTVTPATATLSAPESVGGAMEFDVTWTGPLGRGDYIALVKQGETNPHSYLAYAWASQRRSPTFQAPAEAGTYELWYVLQGGRDRIAIAKKPITVTEPQASVEPPASVEVGEVFEVKWTGPNGSGDLVDIVPVGETRPHTYINYGWVHKDKPVKVRAPADPGTYTMRYSANTSAGRAVIATAPLVVKDVDVTITAPASVKRSEKFEISWTGPNHSGDYLTLAGKEHKKPHQYATYVWARPDGTGTMTAPDKPGTYELRYSLDGGRTRRIVARRRIKVE